jgi:hypothetical protein
VILIKNYESDILFDIFQDTVDYIEKNGNQDFLIYINESILNSAYLNRDNQLIHRISSSGLLEKYLKNKYMNQFTESYNRLFQKAE